jgi:hypothetical protein
MDAAAADAPQPASLNVATAWPEVTGGAARPGSTATSESGSKPADVIDWAFHGTAEEGFDERQRQKEAYRRDKEK